MDDLIMLSENFSRLSTSLYDDYFYTSWSLGQ
jgi:hypothetical protein